MAHAHGAEYDEDRGGPRHPHNYQSYPKDGVVYKATKKVWPWEPPGNHEQEDRMVIPGVFIETLFALAPVPEPEALSPVKFMVKCLSLEAYQAGALSRLIEEGLFVEEDDEGDVAVRVYDDPDDLYGKADELIRQMPDEQALEVKVDSFEWLDDVADQGAGAHNATLGWQCQDELSQWRDCHTA